MDSARKRRFFDLLLGLGFKEIEVGFPAASKADFDFVRVLVEDDLIPDDVTIAVLTQARPGADRADVRGGRRRAGARSCTSTTRRRRRSGGSCSGSTRQASRRSPCAERRCARSLQPASDAEIMFEYSPESFHHTELDYALEICEAVADEWGPTPAEKMIVNLPTTVEHFPPNVYADRIEWFARNFSKRESIVLSIHPHNDRGTAVATAELGLMAGGDRVEGTLFGNGERTGNVDLVTLALNLLTQGVDPGLDFSQLDETKRIVEECNELPVHPRHPWVGELVYTAFSGSHQDAIKKGMHAQQRSDVGGVGRPVPADRSEGRRTRLRGDHPRQLAVGEGRRRVPARERVRPRPAARAPGRLRAEGAGDHRRRGRRALGRASSTRCSTTTYLAVHRAVRARVVPARGRREAATGSPPTMRVGDETVEFAGEGNGPIAALVHGLGQRQDMSISVLNYHEHAMSTSEDAVAAAYVEIDVDGLAAWGVGLHSSIVTASLRAVVNAVNRAAALRAEQAAVLHAFDAV